MFQEPDETTPVYISPYEVKNTTAKRGRPRKYDQQQILDIKNEIAKEYYKNNLQHCKEVQKAYYKNNSEMIKERVKQWYNEKKTQKNNDNIIT